MCDGFVIFIGQKRPHPAKRGNPFFREGYDPFESTHEAHDKQPHADLRGIKSMMFCGVAIDGFQVFLREGRE
jgi:hypothetical protein